MESLNSQKCYVENVDKKDYLSKISVLLFGDDIQENSDSAEKIPYLTSKILARNIIEEKYLFPFPTIKWDPASYTKKGVKLDDKGYEDYIKKDVNKNIVDENVFFRLLNISIEKKPEKDKIIEIYKILKDTDYDKIEIGKDGEFSKYDNEIFNISLDYDNIPKFFIDKIGVDKQNKQKICQSIKEYLEWIETKCPNYLHILTSKEARCGDSNKCDRYGTFNDKFFRSLLIGIDITTKEYVLYPSNVKPENLEDRNRQHEAVKKKLEDRINTNIKLKMILRKYFIHENSKGMNKDILKLEGKELVDLLFKVENHNDPSAEPKRTSLKDLKLNNWWIFRRGCPNGDMYYELPDKHKKGETNTRKPEYIYTKLMCAKYDSCYVDSKSSCKECHKSEVDSLSSESTNLECITDAENTKIESISKLLSELDKTSDDNLEIDTNLVLSIKKPESEKMFTINLIRYKWDNDKLKLKEYSIDTKDKLDLYNTIYEHYTGSNKENADAHLLDYFQAKCTNCPDFKLTKTGDERYASTEAKQKHQEKSLSFLKKNEKLEKEKKQTYTNLKREVQAIKEKQKQLAEKQQQEEIKSAIIDQTISLAGKIGASGIKPLAEAFTKGKSSKINQISDDDFIPQLSNELVSGLPLSNIIASCESDIFKFIDHRNINDFNNVNEKLIELDEEKNNF